jgi:hypothetical protein
MIFEVTFWIAFILASQAITKIYYRRRDVLRQLDVQRSKRLANKKTPPHLDGAKFGRRHEIANAPRDGSCHDSGVGLRRCRSTTPSLLLVATPSGGP